MKTFITYSFLALASFTINFAIYNISMSFQARVYMSEWQKMESGLLMIKTTIPAFFIASIIFAVIFYWVSKKFNKNKYG